jgi:ATP:ADP antiporter, AAA family
MQPSSSGHAASSRTLKPWLTVLAIGGAAAFLLFGYEFVRSVSTSLFIGAYGAQNLPVVMALGPVGTILVVYVYGVLLSRLGPERAVLATSAISAAVLVGCYVALQRGINPAAGVLYVFREAYIVVLVEQYWSFINSTFKTKEARQVNGPITGLGSAGAVLGGMLVSLYAKRLGSEVLLLFAAVSLLPAGLLSWLAYASAGEPQPAPEEAGGRQGHLALRLFARSPYLVYLACLIATTQVVSTVLDLRFSGLLETAMPLKDARTAYLGGFYARINIAAFLMQFVATPVLLKLVALPLLHGAIPLVHLLAGLLLLLRPSLLTGALAYGVFKVLDYSIFRAAKEIFYIPLSFDARYRAKSVIDAFGYRLAKGSASLLLGVAGRVFGKLPGAIYPAVALAASAVWLPLVLRLTLGRPPDNGAAGQPANPSTS